MVVPQNRRTDEQAGSSMYLREPIRRSKIRSNDSLDLASDPCRSCILDDRPRITRRLSLSVIGTREVFDRLSQVTMYTPRANGVQTAIKAGNRYRVLTTFPDATELVSVSKRSIILRYNSSHGPALVRYPLVGAGGRLIAVRFACYNPVLQSSLYTPLSRDVIWQSQ